MPEGATPKDGPSAGIGMCTALVSALTRIPVRSDVAMTGEITLRGEVLPIGGLKEKLLAAQRGGIKTVLIPEENQKDLVEIPDNIKGNLEIKPVTLDRRGAADGAARQPADAADAGRGRRRRRRPSGSGGGKRDDKRHSAQRSAPEAGAAHRRALSASRQRRAGSRDGCLAQLVERRLYTANVGGSIPSAPTNYSPLPAASRALGQSTVSLQ